MAGMMLLFAGAIKQPSLTAYAAEGQETQATQIISYGQATAKALGAWELQSDQTTWKFKQVTGDYLTSAWIEDATQTGVWYFVDASGNMLRSQTTPDGYWVDAEGKWFSGTTSSTGTSGSTQQTAESQQTGESQENSNNNTNNTNSAEATGGGYSSIWDSPWAPKRTEVYVDEEAARELQEVMKGLD